MISTYDDEIDTITQIMIDWFTNRIRQLDEFNQDQIYQSTLMIDEKTPLPCIGFYRNRIEPYEGNDKCVGKEKYSFDFAVCYFTNPTTPEYYNNVLYQLNSSNAGHFKIVKDGQVFKTFVDGVEKTAQQVNTNITGACRVGFRTNSTSTIQFRNFVIY